MGASLGSLLLGKTVILPSTRVDPAQFPEADFPVFCPQCRYELRGLTEPRCPECGSPFDRGQLLVQQYVLTPAPSNWRTAARWLQRLATFVILLFGSMILFTSRFWIFAKLSLWINFLYFGCLSLAAVAALIGVWRARRPSALQRKRRAVYEAALLAMKERWSAGPEKRPVDDRSI